MSKTKVIDARLEELTKRLFDTLYTHVSIGHLEESGLFLRLASHTRPELSEAEHSLELARVMELADRDVPLTAQGMDFRKELWTLLRTGDTPNLQGD